MAIPFGDNGAIEIEELRGFGPDPRDFPVRPSGGDLSELLLYYLTPKSRRVSPPGGGFGPSAPQIWEDEILAANQIREQLGMLEGTGVQREGIASSERIAGDNRASQERMHGESLGWERERHAAEAPGREAEAIEHLGRGKYFAEGADTGKQNKAQTIQYLRTMWSELDGGNGLVKVPDDQQYKADRIRDLWASVVNEETSPGEAMAYARGIMNQPGAADAQGPPPSGIDPGGSEATEAARRVRKAEGAVPPAPGWEPPPAEPLEGSELRNERIRRIADSGGQLRDEDLPAHYDDLRQSATTMLEMSLRNEISQQDFQFYVSQLPPGDQEFVRGLVSGRFFGKVHM